MSTQWVTIGKFALETGYTEKAIRKKIERGDWLQGSIWTKAPDGRILLTFKGYEQWVENTIKASHRQARRA